MVSRWNYWWEWKRISSYHLKHRLTIKKVPEKFHSISSGLYVTRISVIESQCQHSQSNKPKTTFSLAWKAWSSRNIYDASYYWRFYRTSFKTQKVIPQDELSCSVCFLRKLIVWSSLVKLQTESTQFLGRIQGDICGPIHPSSGTFRYFIDASTRWSLICLYQITCLNNQ